MLQIGSYEQQQQQKSSDFLLGGEFHDRLLATQEVYSMELVI
jgi:hypothetical protein